MTKVASETHFYRELPRTYRWAFWVFTLPYMAVGAGIAPVVLLIQGQRLLAAVVMTAAVAYLVSLALQHLRYAKRFSLAGSLVKVWSIGGRRIACPTTDARVRVLSHPRAREGILTIAIRCSGSKEVVVNHRFPDFFAIVDHLKDAGCVFEQREARWWERLVYTGW